MSLIDEFISSFKDISLFSNYGYQNNYCSCFILYKIKVHLPLSCFLGKMYFDSVIISYYLYISFLPASSVFFISDTMVMGPTPPGTGVM